MFVCFSPFQTFSGALKFLAVSCGRQGRIYAWGLFLDLRWIPLFALPPLCPSLPPSPPVLPWPSTAACYSPLGMVVAASSSSPQGSKGHIIRVCGCLPRVASCLPPPALPLCCWWLADTPGLPYLLGSRHATERPPSTAVSISRVQFWS